MVEITPKDLERFHKNAPAALTRRGRGFAAEELSRGAQTIFFGALPIVGLLLWDWSGIEMLLFLIAGMWIGIVCDSVKFFALRGRAEAFANAMYDDWHVWVVVGALRSGTHKAPPDHLHARWQPIAGVVVDYFFGGVSTAFIIATLVAEGVWEPSLLENTYFLLGLVAMAGMRIASTAWEIFTHRVHRKNGAMGSDGRRDDAMDRPVKVVVGLRGVGLFLLVFLVAVFADNKKLDVNTPRIMMLVVNGCIVLWGVMNLLGPLIVWRETKWLRGYLAEREGSKVR